MQEYFKSVLTVFRMLKWDWSNLAYLFAFLFLSAVLAGLTYGGWRSLQDPSYIQGFLKVFGVNQYNVINEIEKINDVKNSLYFLNRTTSAINASVYLFHNQLNSVAGQHFSFISLYADSSQQPSETRYEVQSLSHLDEITDIGRCSVWTGEFKHHVRCPVLANGKYLHGVLHVSKPKTEPAFNSEEIKIIKNQASIIGRILDRQ